MKGNLQKKKRKEDIFASKKRGKKTQNWRPVARGNKKKLRPRTILCTVRIKCPVPYKTSPGETRIGKYWQGASWEPFREGEGGKVEVKDVESLKPRVNGECREGEDHWSQGVQEEETLPIVRKHPSRLQGRKELVESLAGRSAVFFGRNFKRRD